MTTRLDIKGMTCANCATHIGKALEAVPQVTDVRVTLGEGATVEHDNADENALLRAVRAAGDYDARIVG